MANENENPPATQCAPPEPSFKARAAATWAFLKQLGPIGPVALISMTVPGVMGFVLLGTANYHNQWLEHFVTENFPLAVALYIAGFALMAGLPLLPTYAISVVGSYFLGMKWGFVASLLGYTGAAMVSYVFLRLLSGDRVERVIAEHPKWKLVRDVLLIRSPWRAVGIVALLRLPPNLPFAVINLILVTSRIHLLIYLVGSVVGVVPRTLGVAYIVTVFREEILSDKEKTNWYWIVLSIAFTLAILMLISHIAKRALSKLTDKTATQ
jgi:uncharacterized membrane protein YdjX (TVP38/TMEM64 family)